MKPLYLIVFILFIKSRYVMNFTLTWSSPNGVWGDNVNWLPFVQFLSITDSALIANNGTCTVTSSNTQAENLYLTDGTFNVVLGAGFNVSSIQIGDLGKLNNLGSLQSQSISIDGAGGVLINSNNLQTTSMNIIGYFKSTGSGNVTIGTLSTQQIGSKFDIQVNSETSISNLNIPTEGSFIGTGVETFGLSSLIVSGSVSFTNISLVQVTTVVKLYTDASLYFNSSALKIDFREPILQNGSKLFLNNAIILNLNLTTYIHNTYLENNSILNINDGCSIGGSIISSNSKINFMSSKFKNSSQIDVINSNLTGTPEFNDNSALVVSNSNNILAISSGTFKGQSVCRISNSILSVTGNLYFYEDSTFNINSDSQVTFGNSINISDGSAINIENSVVNFNQELYFIGNSFFRINNSNIVITNLITAFNNSQVNVVESNFSMTPATFSSNQIYHLNFTTSIISMNLVNLNAITFEGLNSIFSISNSILNLDAITITNSKINLVSSTLQTISEVITLHSTGLSLENSKFQDTNYNISLETNSKLFIESSDAMTINSLNAISSTFELKNTFIVFNGDIIVKDGVFQISNSQFSTKKSQSLENSIFNIETSKVDLSSQTILGNDAQIKIQDSNVDILGPISVIPGATNTSVIILGNSNVNFKNSDFHFDELSVQSPFGLMFFINSNVLSGNCTNNGAIQSLNSSLFNLNNNGLITTVDTVLKINGDYQESLTSKLDFSMTSPIQEPILQISGKANFQGSLIARVDIRQLSSTSDVSYLLANYSEASGSINQFIIYSIDPDNNYLQIPINNYCNIKLNQTVTSLSLIVGNCKSNIIVPTQKCKGTPVCSGKGVCESDGCKCTPPYFGSDCSSRQIIIDTPKSDSKAPNTNLSYYDGQLPNGETVSFSSMIGIVELREIDLNNKVVYNFTFNHWIYTNQTDQLKTKYLYSTLITKPNQSIKTNVTVLIQWFKISSEIQFAGLNISMAPSTIKYNIQISKYPFASLLNRLELILSASAQLSTNENEICSKQEFDIESGTNNTFEYLKIQMNSHSLYGRFIKRGVIDDRNTLLTNKLEYSSILNENRIGIIIPSFNQKAVLDPDFSVLIDSNSLNSDDDGVTCSNQIKPKDNGLSKQQLAGIIIGAIVGFIIIVIIILYFIMKKYRYSNTILKLRSKL